MITEFEQRKFLARIALPNEQGCMEWQGSIHPKGYGQLKVRSGTHKAHRVSYEYFVGPIPEGLVIDHLCRNRKCANPDHLEPVTPGENSRRGEVGIKSGQQMKAKTHCPQGHEYNEENTYIRKNGNRQCRVCGREQARARRAETS